MELITEEEKRRLESKYPLIAWWGRILLKCPEKGPGLIVTAFWLFLFNPLMWFMYCYGVILFSLIYLTH